MKERAMRRVSGLLLILLLMLGMASRAVAADYDLPILRGSSQPPAPVLSVGPATFTRWSGFYVGGNVSLGSAYSDFSKTTAPLVTFSLQHTTVESTDHPSDFQVLGNGSSVKAGGGAFLGYNTQWQDLVLGVEATYTHTNLNTTAPSTAVARSFPDSTTAVGVSANGNLNLTDFGTARGRAGYVVGNFLPYGFVGMAVGRASYSVTTVADVAQPISPSTTDFPALTPGNQRRHANFCRSPTALDKTTPCSGAIRSAPDWIGP
jgi:outer membrane immunogenic protein